MGIIQNAHFLQASTHLEYGNELENKLVLDFLLSMMTFKGGSIRMGGKYAREPVNILQLSQDSSIKRNFEPQMIFEGIPIPLCSLSDKIS